MAYEHPYENPATGEIVPGRVRILPLNPSFCFVDWHPHDASRMLRFKLKYRFWSTDAAGVRKPSTYVEIITDELIEEYINDELIDRRPNPLGTIPVVHIANKPVAASPWGLSDIVDLIPLNRTYNELVTELLDIVNYHVNPITIVTGAKATNLERGAGKMWAIPSKDAKVENLAGGFDGIAPALELVDRIKVMMHEISGVPENALGQEQNISNTSGVALAVQYFPTLLKYNLKKTQYGNGIRKISQLALQTLFCFEPETLAYDPDTMGIMHDDQPPMISATDPQVYNLDIKFPPPLPQDELVLLNEIQAKLALGLESKEGALETLGEQYPDEKLQQLFEEQVNDTKMEAARRLVSTHIDSLIAQMTGIVPDGAGEPLDGGETQQTETRKPDGTKTTQTRETTPTLQQSSSGPLPGLPGLGDMVNAAGTNAGDNLLRDIVSQAYGSTLPRRRLTSKNSNSDTDA